MESSETPQSELNATHRWVIGLIITIVIQSGTVFFWAATLQAKVNTNTRDIAKVSDEVSDLSSDIREILIGIEQVKGRLGIIEVKE